jgi:hypothetical protein
VSSYRHPVLVRERESTGSGIFDTKDQKFVTMQGSTLGYNRFDETLEEFFARLRESEKVRKALGIPNMIYHAYSFPYRGYNVQAVRTIVEWARGHDLEVRSWINEESALLLVTIADPDTSEDSGSTLYDYVHQSNIQCESYGLASWFEYVQFGVPLPDDWQLIERSNALMAASPDGRYFAYLGG